MAREQTKAIEVGDDDDDGSLSLSTTKVGTMQKQTDCEMRAMYSPFLII